MDLIEYSRCTGTTRLRLLRRHAYHLIVSPCSRHPPRDEREADVPYSCAQALDAERAHLRGVGASEADGYSALCLSGGGIRSAAFALGVIEALAKLKVLAAFDYLSTVSGGGFTGGWLTAWLHHAAADGDRDKVFRQLSGAGLEDGRTEAAPVSHIRAYSRYLSPQLGALSADSWTLVATMLRNVFLNWTVLLPLIAAGLLAPRVYLELVQAFDRPLLAASAPAISVLEPSTLLDAARMNQAATWLLIVSVILQFGGVAYMVTDLPSYGNRRRPQSDFLLYCLTPIIVGTVGLTLFWPLNVVPLPLGFIVGVSVVASVVTWMVFGLNAATRRFRPLTWAAAAMTAPIAATGLWWLTSEPFGDGVHARPTLLHDGISSRARFDWHVEHGICRAVERRQRGGGPRVALALQRVDLHHDRCLARNRDSRCSCRRSPSAGCVIS